MAELCDVYNINGNKTGEVFVRGQALREGEYQLVTNIWIINNDFNILIQKKAIYGGCPFMNWNIWLKINPSLSTWNYLM